MGKELSVKPLQIDGSDYVMVCGSFEGGASSATTKLTGQGWTIGTGSGSGVYTIAFDPTYTIANLISFVATVSAETVANVDTYIVVTDHDTSSGSNLVITTSEGGTPTDIAADEYVYFQAVFSVSSLALNRPRS